MNPARIVVVIKTGSTLPELLSRRGDFEEWIIEGMGISRQEVSILDVRNGDVLPSPALVAGTVITGSHHMVTQLLDWSERTARWLRRASEADVPILGICYGHQLLAHALGGTVADNPRGHEYGTVSLQLTSAAAADPLFGEIPETFPAQNSHTQSVLALPPAAVRLASSEKDHNQAFRVGRTAWGVQFHPEFDGEITRAYIRHRQVELTADGQDPASLEERVAPTPAAAGLLRRFAALIREASPPVHEIP
jgi:GMP synthase (glutamine-hydrolysing)